MLIKVKIHSSVNNAHNVITKALVSFNIKFSNITRVDGDYYIVWCNTESDSDTLMSSECLTVLKSQHCSPILPPDLKAKRSVIIKFVDTSIYSMSEQQLIEEIELKNNSLKVTELYKLQRSRSIKITFTSQDMANSARLNGIKVKLISVSPDVIVKDIFIDVLVCYRCYRLDHHRAAQCPKDSSYKVCSQCAQTGHTHKECTSTAKQCLNCNGNHSSIAYNCPKRKDIEREKRTAASKQTTQPGNVTGTSSVTRTVTPAIQSVPAGDLFTSIIRANACVTLAATLCSGQRDSFEGMLQELLAANNLPSLALGNIVFPATYARVAGSSNILPELNTAGVMRKADGAPTVDSPITQPGAPRQQPAKSSPAALGRGDLGSDRRATPKPSPKSSTPNLPSMKIFKKRGTRGVHAGNIKTLAHSGKVLIECDDMSETECINLISTNKSDSDLFVIELDSSDFAAKLISRPINRPKTRNNAS